MNRPPSKPLHRNIPNAKRGINLQAKPSKGMPQVWSSKQIDCTFQANKAMVCDRTMIKDKGALRDRENFIDRHLLNHSDLTYYTYERLVKRAREKTEHMKTPRTYHTFVVATAQDFDTAFKGRFHFIEGNVKNQISGLNPERFVSTTCFTVVTVIFSKGTGSTEQPPVVVCHEAYPVVRILASSQFLDWPIYDHMFGYVLDFAISGYYALAGKMLKCCKEIRVGQNLDMIVRTFDKTQLTPREDIDTICPPPIEPSTQSLAIQTAKVTTTTSPPSSSTSITLESKKSAENLGPPPMRAFNGCEAEYVQKYNDQFTLYLTNILEKKKRMTIEVAIQMFQFMLSLASDIDESLSELRGLAEEYSKSGRGKSEGASESLSIPQNPDDEMLSKLIWCTNEKIQNLNSAFEYMVPRGGKNRISAMGVLIDTEDNRKIEVEEWVFHIDAYFGLIVAGFFHQFDVISSELPQFHKDYYTREMRDEDKKKTEYAGELLKNVYFPSMDIIKSLIEKLELQIQHPIRAHKDYKHKPVPKPNDPEIKVNIYVKEVKPLNKKIEQLDSAILAQMTLYFDIYFDLEDRLKNSYDIESGTGILYLFTYAADATIEYGKVSDLLDYSWEMIDRT